MNVAVMRIVDEWIGVPLCAFLTLIRRVEDLVLRRRPPSVPKRVAAIKMAEQGATVLAYPALDRLRKAVGKENVFFVVFSQNRFIVDLLDIVPRENVLEIKTTNIFRTTWDVLRVVARMHRERIDVAIDCEFFARSSAILTYLSGARIRIGFHAFANEASYRGDLLTHRLSFNHFLHAGQIFHLLVDAIWQPPERLPALDVMPAPDHPLPRYVPPAARLKRVEGIVRETLGVQDIPPLVLLNANCGDLLPIRRWGRERYVELAHLLLDQYPDAVVAFTGSPDEAADACALAAEVAHPRCVSLAGKTTLEELLVLYCLSDLLVTNDSGPGHFASVTPMDAIVLFGPETPTAFGPRSPQSHVLWAGVACSPCVHAYNDRLSPCRDNVCMQRIPTEDVFALACEILDRRLGIARLADGKAAGGPEREERGQILTGRGPREPKVAVRRQVPGHDGDPVVS